MVGHLYKTLKQPVDITIKIRVHVFITVSQCDGHNIRIFVTKRSDLPATRHHSVELKSKYKSLKINMSNFAYSHRKTSI